MSELVSVVLPTFRRGDFLGRAIASVYAQTWRNWELVVVDDNDPDSEDRRETERFMASFASDPQVVYLRHDRNRGGSAARNTGIRAARGDLVAFLDDDDVWEADKLEKQVDRLRSSPPGTGMVYCGYHRIDLRTGARRTVLPNPANHSLESLLRENGIGTTSAVLCRRSLLLDVGLFDESLPSRQDIDLYVRLAQACRFEFVPEPLLSWYRHEGDAIGKNRGRSIEAHRRFLVKYDAELSRHPRAYSYRQERLGVLLLFEGRLAEARAAFAQAWRKSRVNWRAVMWCLVANPPVFGLYRRLADGVRTRRAHGRLTRAA